MKRNPLSRLATRTMEVGLLCSAVVLWLGACSDHDGQGDADSADDSVPGGDDDSADVPDPTTLKGKYADYFLVGAAIDSDTYKTHSELLERHFNSVTVENSMKAGSLQRSEGNFGYTAADRLVDYAADHGMAVRGHALVWHRQNPSWMFVDEDGQPASEELLLQRMESHITNVVSHFKGRVYAWDVVNEAIMDDGTYRTGEEEREDWQSSWYAILGERYIAEAFKLAAKADPDAKLFYNDFYNYLPAKQEAIYDMLAGLLEDGVPIHGVGLQCHLNIQPSSDPEHQGYYQSVENLEKAIDLYSSLGLEVHITEMDVSLYVPGVQYTEETFYTSETFTEELEHQQAERYREFFELFRKHRQQITSVTLWGIADDNTWLSELSSGRDDFPLLFDTEQEPKQAFDAVMDF